MKPEDFFIPEKLCIKGGKPAMGTVEISGAKNSILGLMAAALLTDEEVILNNVPYITDVIEMGHIMSDLGVDVKYNPVDKKLFLHALNIKNNVLSDKALKFRASYYLWGALLARFKHTHEFTSLKVLVPGGCSFGGARPTDFHEQLIRNIFSAEIEEIKEDEKTYLEFTLPEQNNEDDCCPIYTTAKVSHGATFHWLLSIAGTKNFKMMYNSSLEPEVSNLLSMLQDMGLKVAGSDRTGLIYYGDNRRLLRGGTFDVIPDRLEAATYALLALGTRGVVKLKGIKYEHCVPWVKQLGKTLKNGIYYSYDKDILILEFMNVAPFNGVCMQMSPFPGFETDLQQVWTPILSMASSDSIIVDMVWPGRSAHLAEMKKFGLESEFKHIEVSASQTTSQTALMAKIKPSKLKGAKASGTDLRGTMGTILIALMAKGKSEIENPSFALRGYPNVIENLKNLGLDVTPSKAGTTIDSLPMYKG